jgi:asparagine synthase (glutamine-hydrolysing)
MYFSIENRAPFLSHKLFEYSNTISDDCLINNGYGKAILRDALSGILPKSILSFREKIGFYANINKFFKMRTKKFRDQIFQSDYINSFIRMNRVNKLLKKDFMNNAEAKFIFCILNLAILSKLN